MELKDFITSAIADISEAVTEADKRIEKFGGLVNPGGYQHHGDNPKSYVAARTTLNFDIAVSAENSSSGNAAAKAKIWVVEATLGGEGAIKNETVSRLTFSIDVVLPHDTKQSDRVGLVKRE